MSIVPPASATLIWALPTEFEVVRCFVWEHSPAGWSIAIMFGDETLALEVAPTRWAMETGVDMVWRGLMASGIGKLASGSKTLAAMSGVAGEAETPAGSLPGEGDIHGSSRNTSNSRESDKSHYWNSERVVSDAPRMRGDTLRPTPLPRPIPRGTFPPRFEDPFCPHTPFRHREPSFDVDIDEPDPSPRRRPH